MKYLTLKQAEEVYHVSHNTMYRWVRTGKLEAKHIGRKWLVIESANDMSEPVAKSLLANAFKDFAGDIIADCAYLDSSGEIELHSDKLEVHVTKYAELVTKLINWNG